LLQLCAETNFSVLFVSHSIAEAIQDRNRILLAVRRIPAGSKAEVFDVDRVSSRTVALPG